MGLIWINGKTYSPGPIFKGKYPEKNISAFEKKIFNTLHEWERGKEYFSFMTSGSTGNPKTVSIHRKQIISSAEGTLKKLNIKGGNAMVCLDTDFIAGFMMLIRAVIGNLDLIVLSPVSDPFRKIPDPIQINLTALVPYQLKKTIEDDIARLKLNKTDHILVGGGDISPELHNQIQPIHSAIYQTFGMTETVSHIALRKINGRDAKKAYALLPGVSIKKDARGCLVVNGAITNNTPVITNDLIDMIDEKHFHWLGRYDHVINTGGIKIIVELLEKKIRSLLESKNISLSFFIQGTPDDALGEHIAIIMENSNQSIPLNEIKKVLNKGLTKYERPREWRIITTFHYTANNKLDRAATYLQAVKIN